MKRSNATLALGLVAWCTTSFAQAFDPPPAPLLPQSEETCRAYEKQWQSIRDQVSQQHQACLDAHKNQKCESAGACSCGACEPLHNPQRFGQAEVADCREQVRRHLEEERRKKQEAAANANTTTHPRQGSREADDPARPGDKPAPPPETSESKLWKNLGEASRAAQDALAGRNKAREEKKEALQGRSDQAGEQYGKDLEKARAHADKAGQAAQAMGGEAHDTGATPTSAGDFDFRLVGEDRADKTREWFTWVASDFNPPFAGISFGIFENSVKATEKAMKTTFDAIANFETADPEVVSRVLEDYRDEVFGPREIARAIFENSMSKALEHRAEARTEALAERLEAGVEARRIGAVLEEPAPSLTSSHRVFHWWSNEPTREMKYLRDELGVPMLFDHKGERFGFDQALGRVTYEAGDVERLVATKGVVPRLVEGSEWKERVLVWTPAADESKEGVIKKVFGWAAGKASEKSAKELADKVFGAEEEK